MQMKNNKVADIEIKALFKYFKYLNKQKKNFNEKTKHIRSIF